MAQFMKDAHCVDGIVVINDNQVVGNGAAISAPWTTYGFASQCDFVKRGTDHDLLQYFKFKHSTLVHTKHPK